MSWIKMRTSLLTDGRVREMSRKLSRSRHAVIGLLFEFWCIGDVHADEFGVLKGWSKLEVNDQLRTENFCESLPSDWIEETPEGFVKLPEYQEHNGATAKSRALAQKRKRNERKRVTQVSRSMSRSTRDASPLILSSTESTRKERVQREETMPCHGDNGHVLLTEDEHSQLCTRHGAELTKVAIEILDAWIETKPGKLAWFQKKYSSAFSVLNPKTSWVWSEVEKRKTQKQKPQNNLEKAREALYGDPRGSVGANGIFSGGVLNVSGDSGASRDLARTTPAVLPGAAKARR